MLYAKLACQYFASLCVAFHVDLHIITIYPEIRMEFNNAPVLFNRVNRLHHRRSTAYCRYNIAKTAVTLLCIDARIYGVRGWVRKFCHMCYNCLNRHDKLLYYTLIERATFLLYNDAKTMYERNKYFMS